MLKNKGIFIVGLLAIILGTSLWINWKQFRSNREQEKRITYLSQNTSVGFSPIINSYVAPDSTQHATTKEVPVKTDAEKKIAVGTYSDTVARALKVALKQVDELTKVNSRLEATIKLTSLPMNLDTNKQRQVDQLVLKTYNDKFLSLVYHPESDSVDLSYNVSLNQAKYWKRSWLLAPKQYYLDFWADDPRVNINSVKRFTTSYPTQNKRFGLGVNAGYNYVPTLNKWYPTVGLSFNYNLVEF